MTNCEPFIEDCESAETPMPDEYCQISITHPAYPTPLLWVCTKPTNIISVIGRWSVPHNLRLLQTPRRQTGRMQLLMYTLPPRNEPKFLPQLFWEYFDDIDEQKVHVAFQLFPPARCTVCHGFGSILPKPECEICYVRPAFHHTECCPHRDEDTDTPGSTSEVSGDTSQGY